MDLTKSPIDLGVRWFNVKLPLVQRSLKDLATFSITKEELDDLFSEAQRLIDDIAAELEGDKRGWYMQQFHNRGTVTDRIAAAAVKLTDNDFMFHMDCFGQLFELARGDAHYFEQALQALAALWPKILPSRPLKRFAAQHFATLPPKESEFERKRVLAYWYIEDALKRTFTQFLALLENGLKDRLLARRECWLDTAGKLLNSVAEGRTAIIAAIVDKMGDPSKTIAHKSYHKLLDMLTRSSQNQAALLTELEKVIFMKNCPLATQRYAVNVMNQLVFSRDGRALAAKCVGAYLSLFRQLVIDGNVDQVVTSAIIVGLRRAFPYAGLDPSALDEHLNALFILAHTGSFAQQVSTMTMLQQVLPHSSKQMENRWYRSLYAMLLASPKQFPHSSQLTGFFTVLYKAVRGDTNTQRIAAFVHRLLQRCLFHNEAFICAVLLLVGDVVKAHPTLRDLIRPSAAARKKQLSATPATPAASAAASAAGKGDKSASSTRVPAGQQQQQQQQGGTQSARYDPVRRDPEYANACSECVWVLSLLSRHSHPSVVRLAVLLLLGEELVLESHPLDGLTITNFLQLFVDAKEKDGAGRSSDSAADASGPATGVPVFRRAVAKIEVPSAADPTFIYATPDAVDVSTMFLHRYAVQRQRFYEQRQRNHSAFTQLLTDDEVGKKLKGSAHNILFGLEVTAESRKAAEKAEKEARKAAADASDADETGDEEESDGEDEEKGGDFDVDFNAVGEDGGIAWGDDDEDAGYDALDEEDLSDGADAGGALGSDDEGDDDDASADDDNDNLSDDDGDAENAAADFDALMAKHRKPKSKREINNEKWLDERSFDPKAAAPRGGGGGGRGGGFARGGRGFSGGRGGRGGSTGFARPAGRHTGAPPTQRKRY